MLTPEQVQDLTTIAFMYEALSDKEGCTTRYVDLPGKPLADFLIAGINSGKFFRRAAEDFQQDGKTGLFKYFPEALKNTNVFKSEKTVNFGLLEVMFVAVKARLCCDNEKAVIEKMIELVKEKNNSDVKLALEARKIAWQTSVNPAKQNYPYDMHGSEESIYEYYLNQKKFPHTDAGHQWALQFESGLPVLKSFYTSFSGNTATLLEEIKSAFQRVRGENPDLKLGIVADMCAAAIFLKLSYQKYGRN